MTKIDTYDKYDYLTAYGYLVNVLNEWKEFCSQHPKFAYALAALCDYYEKAV